MNPIINPTIAPCRNSLIPYSTLGVSRNSLRILLIKFFLAILPPPVFAGQGFSQLDFAENQH